MRDIEKYGNDSKTKNDFEAVQVRYRRKKVLECLNMLPSPPPSRQILEIGCGLEPLFLFYKDFKKYIIAEPCSLFFENAQDLAKQNNKGSIICYNDFLENIETELLNYEFDYIICSGLLHEVESPQQLLKTVFNLCTKDKTIVHINVPNMNSFHRLLAKESGFIKNEHDKSQNNILLQQHTNFDMDILKSMVQDSGLKIINSGSYFIKPFTHSQMKQLMDIDILTNEMLDGLYAMQKYMPNLGSEIFIEAKKSKQI